MKKRLIIMIIALTIVFGGLILFNVVKSFLVKRFFANYQAPAVSVSSVKAVSRNWLPTLHAVGNFSAINGVEVNSQASGNVTVLHFHSGQYIKKDQPLIDIDDSVDLATLKFNEADLALKKINYKRQTDLFSRGATPSSSVDEAKANLEQAQANVEKTKALITQKHIAAPFSGKLGIRAVNLGQYITPGQTSIVSLQSLDPLYLEFYLPEQLFEKIHLGQKITFKVEQNPGLVFEGKISAINSKIDVSTHNIKVQATLANCPTNIDSSVKDSELYEIKAVPHSDKRLIICNSEKNAEKNITKFNFMPGMFANIEVEQPPIANTIVIPSTAVSYSLYGNSVFLIERKQTKEDKKPSLSVKRIFVTLGDQRGNYTIVKSGLKTGDEIVSSGELKLQNGTRVTINNSVPLPNVKNIDSLGQ